MVLQILPQCHVVAGPNVFAGYWGIPGPRRQHCWLAGYWRRRAPGLRRLLLDLRPGEGLYISGGENVYPAEVEEVLLGHAEIAEAAVAGVPDQSWGETGVAFIVPVTSSAIGPKEVTAFCRARLASYKAPRHCRLVTELPRLSNGKTDKMKLRELAVAPVDHGCGAP